MQMVGAQLCILTVVALEGFPEADVCVTAHKEHVCD